MRQKTNAPSEIYSIELETEIINTIVEFGYFDYAKKLITANDFFFDGTRMLFEEMNQMYVNSTDISKGSLTIASINKKFESVWKADGFKFRGSNSTFEQFLESCKELKRLSMTRLSIEFLEKSAKIIERGEPSEFVEYLGFFKDMIETESEQELVKTNKEVIVSTVSDIQKAKLNVSQGKTAGLKTGINNDLFDQVYNDEVVLIAGRPGMGKSIVGVELLRSFSKQYPSMFFSLEMKANSLMNRLISGTIESENLSYSKLKSGRITDQQLHAINTEAVTELQNLPIFWYDEDDRDIETISQVAEMYVKKHGVKVLIIDYVQLVEDKSLGRNQFDEYIKNTQISIKFKKLQKRLGIPIILLAQLSRESEKRKGDEKKPMISDIRSTGQFEQDASRIIGLYRPDYYGRTADPENHIDNYELNLGVLKSRDGSVGDITMYCDVRTSKLRNKYSELNINRFDSTQLEQLSEFDLARQSHASNSILSQVKPGF